MPVNNIQKQLCFCLFVTLFTEDLAEWTDIELHHIVQQHSLETQYQENQQACGGLLLYVYLCFSSIWKLKKTESNYLCVFRRLSN